MSLVARLSTVSKRIVGGALSQLPDSVTGRLLPGHYRFRVNDIPPAPVFASTSPSLLIAPTNFAGQGFQWAAAVRDRGAAQALSLAVAKPGDYAHAVDVRVPVGVYAASTSWSRDLRRAVANEVSHVLVEAGRRPLGSVLTESLDDQVRWMLDRGIVVGYLAHGSDLRLPSRHVEREPDSPFRHGLAREFSRWEWLVRDNLALIARHGLPTLVSTPDLLLDIPSAHWLPVVIDPQAWRSDSPVLERPVPRVVHAPSRGVVKGSELVDAAMAPLVEEGLIEYQRVAGVPHREMPEVYRDADVVLDQFRIGDYGVAACEAMAAGRLVISRVSANARDAVAAQVPGGLPVVEASARDLESTMRAVLDDRDSYRLMAARGPDFVSALHDGVRSATVIERFLAT